MWWILVRFKYVIVGGGTIKALGDSSFDVTEGNFDDLDLDIGLGLRLDFREDEIKGKKGKKKIQVWVKLG